jgi:uncharacterized protein
MWYLDPLYLIIIGPALLLALWAQVKVKLAFSQYSRVGTSTGLTGGQVARHILDANGLREVSVEVTRGYLSDHYDPRKKVLRLSPQVYQQPSIAAAGVAAHEAGHALQDQTGYFPLKFRNAIVPTAQVGSWLAFPMIFIGVLLAMKGLALAGFVLFLVIVLFQIVTLPVELNASRRAKKAVADLGIIRSDEEAQGVSKVLSAAAFTYVAATITALAQLLYFALRLGLIGGRRDD